MVDLEKDAIKYKQESVDHDEHLDLMSDSKPDYIYWSKMPFWTLDEGIALLLGKDPEVVNWGEVRAYVNYYMSSELCLHYDKLRTLVLRAKEMEEINATNTPATFLAWADTRHLEVPDIVRQAVVSVTQESSEFKELLMLKERENEALKEKLSIFENRIAELENLIWKGFDEDASTYSKELAIAVKAHEAISKQWKKGISIKQQITLWLEDNYPKLMNEEKERIAKICNWQKSGGAPCTP